MLSNPRDSVVSQVGVKVILRVVRRLDGFGAIK
jgi:hypothetical protein